MGVHSSAFRCAYRTVFASVWRGRPSGLWGGTDARILTSLNMLQAVGERMCPSLKVYSSPKTYTVVPFYTTHSQGEVKLVFFAFFEQIFPSF